MLQSLEDPYSNYMTQDGASFLQQTSGTYWNWSCSYSRRDNLITVVSPIERGTPGEKSGIKSENKIIKVNGDRISWENMDQAVKGNGRGDPNTKVVLTTYMRKDKAGKK